VSDTELSITELVATIAARARHNPYDPELPELRARLAVLNERHDRERVAQIAAELPAMTPEEVRRVAVVARKIDLARRREAEAMDAARAS
jgi:hypothetical protein